MSKHFADRLIAAVKEKGNPICVGLDPRLNQIPKAIRKKALEEAEQGPRQAAALAVMMFNKGIIDAVHDLVPIVKPQIAFYEIFGHYGMWAYEETIKYAKSKGLLTIADAKRNDIGSTAAAYAQAFLGEISMFEDENEVVMPGFDADSITINHYLGWDGVKPFVEECKKYGKGIFSLVKTSNGSSGDLQDLSLQEGGTVYELMASLLEVWGANDTGDSGYSLLGAVVGATYPEQARAIRKLLPKAIFLVPGYGAQGGGAADVKPCFNEDGLGAVVNSSRGIIFAYEKLDGFDENSYMDAARQAVINMKEDLATIV